MEAEEAAARESEERRRSLEAAAAACAAAAPPVDGYDGGDHVGGEDALVKFICTQVCKEWRISRTFAWTDHPRAGEGG